MASSVQATTTPPLYTTSVSTERGELEYNKGEDFVVLAAQWRMAGSVPAPWMASSVQATPTPPLSTTSVSTGRGELEYNKGEGLVVLAAQWRMTGSAPTPWLTSSVHAPWLTSSTAPCMHPSPEVPTHFMDIQNPSPEVLTHFRHGLVATHREHLKIHNDGDNDVERFLVEHACNDKGFIDTETPHIQFLKDKPPDEASVNALDSPFSDLQGGGGEREDCGKEASVDVLDSPFGDLRGGGGEHEDCGGEASINALDSPFSDLQGGGGEREDCGKEASVNGLDSPFGHLQEGGREPEDHRGQTHRTGRGRQCGVEACSACHRAEGCDLFLRAVLTLTHCQVKYIRHAQFYIEKLVLVNDEKNCANSLICPRYRPAVILWSVSGQELMSPGGTLSVKEPTPGDCLPATNRLEQ